MVVSGFWLFHYWSLPGGMQERTANYLVSFVDLLFLSCMNYTDTGLAFFFICSIRMTLIKHSSTHFRNMFFITRKSKKYVYINKILHRKFSTCLGIALTYFKQCPILLY